MTEADSIACDHSTAFEPDRVVRLVATDGYQVHRLIYEVLAKDGVRDFLFAPFPAAGGLHAVLVRSCDARTSFAEGQRFRMTLRAMPSVKMAGRRRSIGGARSKDSLRLRLDSRAGARPRLHAPVGARDAGRLRALLVERILSEDRNAAARRKLAQGIGRGIRGPDESCTLWILDPRFPLPKSMARAIGGPGQGKAVNNLPFINCIPSRFRKGRNPAVDRGRVWHFEPRVG